MLQDVINCDASIRQGNIIFYYKTIWRLWRPGVPAKPWQQKLTEINDFRKKVTFLYGRCRPVYMDKDGANRKASLFSQHTPRLCLLCVTRIFAYRPALLGIV